MLSVFVARALAASETGNGCPPGVEYFFDRTINVTIEPKSWYYFYTSHANRDEPLFYDIKSENPMSLYIGQHSRCPSSESELLAEIPGGNRLTSVHVPCENEYSIIVSGLYSETGTNVTVKLMGQGNNHKKKGSSQYIKIIVLFFAMLATAVLYFVKCILPPIKKEKED